MEPIKINIEVSLSEATIAALKGIFGAQIIPTTAVVNTLTEKAAPAAPAPIGADPIGTGAEDDDDLPPADAPAPKKTPTEADARQAVAETKKRGVAPSIIRAFMKDSFGISSSVECPEERRQEFIDGLRKLSA